jgi:hypothetical protein
MLGVRPNTPVDTGAARGAPAAWGTFAYRPRALWDLDRGLGTPRGGEAWIDEPPDNSHDWGARGGGAGAQRPAPPEPFAVLVGRGRRTGAPLT